MIKDEMAPAVGFSGAVPTAEGEGTSHDPRLLYLSDVMRYVSSFVRPVEEAEDVTMEVMEAACRHASRMRRSPDPRLWLLGVARRKVADSLRRRYRRREATLEDRSLPTADAFGGAEERAVVEAVLGSLGEDQREALVLKYGVGLSTEEVARVLGRSEAAANSLLQRARAAFVAAGSHLFDHRGEGIR